MKNLYTVIAENPNLTKGKNFMDDDIAAANYIYMMSIHLTNSEVTNDGAWIHTNSKYNEVVAKIIESHPRVTELLLSLKNGFSFFGGYDSQFAYLLVQDYLKNNLETGSIRHK